MLPSRLKGGKKDAEETYRKDKTKIHTPVTVSTHTTPADTWNSIIEPLCEVNAGVKSPTKSCNIKSICYPSEDF